MTSAKRTLFVTPSPRKRAKTTAQLTKDVSKLARQVNANRPEMRQQAYTVDIPANLSDPYPLLDLESILGDEFKLHRIRVTIPAIYLGTSIVGSWAMLYSPKEGYSAMECLPEPTLRNSPDNLLFTPDATKIRIWDTQQYADYSNADAGTPTESTALSRPLELNKKFSIPMKCGNTLANQAAPVTIHNQIYLCGQAPSGETATVYVTVWFTDP